MVLTETLRPSAGRCAYCAGPGPLTTEHVIPAFLYRRFPAQKFGYNPRAGAFITYEATVRDVCRNCNTGPLSGLDAYAKRFYTESECHRRFLAPVSVTLRYDHGQLCRWLLKVSYNAARFSGQTPTDPFQPFIPYILYGAAPPADLVLAAEVLLETPLTELERAKLHADQRHWRYLPAKGFRCSAIGIVLPLTGGARVSGRLVGIDAFYFYVLTLRHASTGSARRAALRSIRSDLNCTILPPTLTDRTLPAARTMRDVIEPSMKAQWPPWQRFLRAQRRLTPA